MRVFLILTILSFNSLAQTTLEQCSSDALYLGSQTNIPRSIPADCSLRVIENIGNYNQDISHDSKVKVFGVKNMLYTEIYQDDGLGGLSLFNTHMTSGENSSLSNILAVDVNSTDTRTYVLNETDGQYQVYSYYYADGGNNVPVRKLITPEIINATNLKVHSEKIYIISSTDSWLKIFNRLADPDGPRENNSTSVLGSITGANSEIVTPLDIAVSSSEIFILESSKILVFNKLDNGNVSPSRSISGINTQLIDAIKLNISTDESKILVTLNDNTKLTFLINDSGDISPQ